MPLSRTCLARRTVAAGSALLVAGCATFSPDGGVDAVRSLANGRLGTTLKLPAAGADSAAAVRDLLAKPLTVESALQIALLNNPGLSARFAELGIVESDVVQAGRFANPRFSYGNRRSSDAVSIDRTVLFNVVSLLTMPLAQKVAARQFETAQLRVAGEVLQLAADTRRAWYSAVAAQETAQYFEQARLAAEAGAELADKMAAAGNFSRLAQMRERAFLADTETQLAKAKLAAAVERERLTRLLGLSAADARFELQERLPELPAAPLDEGSVEKTALDRRIDVLAAKRNAESTAANLGLVRASGFINVLELGYSNESDTGERRLDGYAIEVELPLFDWGDAKRARAQATYMQSVAHAAEIAVAAQSEIREAHRAYRTAYDVARRYRDEIVPLRKRIADENLLRYNGMLLGVFELLADAREQVASVNASIEALRDFWIADTDLQLAINGTSPAGRAAR